MHKRIADVFLDGFAGHSAAEGDAVEVITRAVATSDEPVFYVFAEQIASLTFPQLERSTGDVDRYLMVLHDDGSADVYLDDFRVEAQARVTRPMAAGEALRRAGSPA